MYYVHPLFDSKIEEVSPPQLARALGFLVDSVEFCFDNDALGELWSVDLDAFYRCWNPEPPEGYVLVGKYESEDGPCAFFAKPDSLLSFELFYNGEFAVSPNPKITKQKKYVLGEWV